MGSLLPWLKQLYRRCRYHFAYARDLVDIQAMFLAVDDHNYHHLDASMPKIDLQLLYRIVAYDMYSVEFKLQLSTLVALAETMARLSLQLLTSRKVLCQALQQHNIALPADKIVNHEYLRDCVPAKLQVSELEHFRSLADELDRQAVQALALCQDLFADSSAR